MKKYIFFALLLVALIVIPGVGMAQTPFEELEIDFVEPGNQAGLSPRGLAAANPTSCSNNINDLGDMMCRIGELINYAIPILLALGVLYFVWGVVQYFIGNDEEAKKRGKDRIVFGIIGLAVIVSVWGLVAIVIETFGIEGSAPDVNLLNFRVDPASQPGDSALFCSLNDNPKLQNLLGYATCIITKSVVPLIFAISLAAFVWGVVQYVILSDSDEKRAQGRQFMLWGIIALTVMIGVWGLVSIVAETFNIENVIPQVKGQPQKR